LQVQILLYRHQRDVHKGSLFQHFRFRLLCPIAFLGFPIDKGYVKLHQAKELPKSALYEYHDIPRFTYSTYLGIFEIEKLVWNFIESSFIYVLSQNPF
jgi:hypothetical protein